MTEREKQACGGCFGDIDDAISPEGVDLPSVSGTDRIWPKNGETAIKNNMGGRSGGGGLSDYQNRPHRILDFFLTSWKSQSS